MMTFTFKQRSNRLLKICSNSKLKKVTDLISIGKVDQKNLSYIQETSKVLLHACILGLSKNVKVDCDFNKIFDEIKKNKPDNITHNGLVVPRKENSLEYGIFMKSVLSLLEDLGINKFIDYFVSPPQLRIKLGEKSYNYNSSDHIHSDAWTPYNTDKSYTLYLPIFGDCKRNFVRFFRPKKNFFDPGWLKPKKFVAGSDIGKSYEIVNLDYKLGSIIVTDCATLHQSILKPNALPRVSIDIAFIPKKIFKRATNISHVKKDKIDGVGYDKLFIFRDSFKDSLKKILSRNKVAYIKSKASTYNRFIYKF